jgi:hypothetical protein
MKRYDWNDTAKVWENYIDSYSPIGRQGKWDDPLRQIHIPEGPPSGMSNEQFVGWCFGHLLESPDRINSYDACKYAASLDFGCFVDGQYGPHLEPFSVETMFNIFKSKANEFNTFELLRKKHIDISPMNFLTKGIDHA